MKTLLKSSLTALLAAGLFVSCDSVLEPSVDQAIPTDQAVKTVDDLVGLVKGAHDRLNTTALYGRDFYVGPDVMSDNAFSNGASGRFVIQSQFNFVVTNGYSSGLWNGFYAVIANANIAINADLPSSDEVDYAKGQAYALRALAHMNLLLAFGQQFVDGGDAALGVPYVTTYAQGNNYPARDAIATVWTNIENDFKEAATLMDPALDGDVTLINYYTVKALQSRYYLYAGKFADAIDAADVVIDSGNFDLVAAASFADAWASGSGPSSLFELAFTSSDRLATDNIARILRPTNYGDVEVTQDLYDAYDAADVRLTLLTENAGTYRMTGKYIDELGTDNVRVVRYAEVLLNKAEALARSGQGPAALTIINDLSAARGSARVYDAGSVANVLAERRLELALEGHRLFDLARHGLDIPNVTVGSPGLRFDGDEDTPDLDDMSYGDYRLALPIPNAEMNANPQMVQNKGYTE